MNQVSIQMIVSELGPRILAADVQTVEAPSSAVSGKNISRED